MPASRSFEPRRMWSSKAGTSSFPKLIGGTASVAPVKARNRRREIIFGTRNLGRRIVTQMRRALGLCGDPHGYEPEDHTQECKHGDKVSGCATTRCRRYVLVEETISRSAGYQNDLFSQKRNLFHRESQSESLSEMRVTALSRAVGAMRAAAQRLIGAVFWPRSQR